MPAAVSSSHRLPPGSRAVVPGGTSGAEPVSIGRSEFFLTMSPTPYELRWRATSAEPFEPMHVYLSRLTHHHEAVGLGNDARAESNGVTGARDQASGRSRQLG